MRDVKRRLWVMRSGQQEEAHTDFVDRRYLSLGWRRLGDLTKLEANQKALRAKYREHYSNETPAAVRMKAGELFRFVHRMKRKDFVVYPSATDELVYFGVVTRPYEYRPRQNSGYPHRRKVRWIRNVPRETLSRKARRAISRRTALYQPRRHARELRAMFRSSEIR